MGTTSEHNILHTQDDGEIFFGLVLLENLIALKCDLICDSRIYRFCSIKISFLSSEALFCPVLLTI